MACDSPAGRLGLSVCYDLRFPELYQRLAWDLGAQVLLVPSAFTVTTGGMAGWGLQQGGGVTGWRWPQKTAFQSPASAPPAAESTGGWRAVQVCARRLPKALRLGLLQAGRAAQAAC